MSFCSLEEAFQGPPSQINVGNTFRGSDNKSSKKKKTREHFAPSQLTSVPDPDRQVTPPPPATDILVGPPAEKAPTESGVNLDSLFPLPGETGEVEEWQNAFTLEGSRIAPAPAPAPSVRSDGSLVVSDQPTLWRQIATPATPMPSVAAGGFSDKLMAIPSEINTRLEVLTRQLESLSTPTPLQGTAELFLFVAIGLMILLAIDTILRFAVSLSERRIMAGGARMMVGGGSGMFK